MKEEKYHSRIVDYLDGNLTAKEAEELRRMLEEEGYDLSRLEEMESLVRQMDEAAEPEPGKEMGNRFYRMLEDEKARMASKRQLRERLLNPLRNLDVTPLISRTLYPALILIVGIVIGLFIPRDMRTSQSGQMAQEIQDMKEMMALVLFEQSSATERLRAVHYTSGISRPDNVVLEALFKTLNTDPSVNVRMASLETLMEKTGIPEVRIGLVQAISQQDAPMVQLAIARLMISLGEESAVPEMEKLLEKENLNETVEEQLKEGIKLLT